MLVVIALGGNALLRRGEPLDATVQRANVKVAAEVIAEISRDHQVVLTHGNGPQVGLLALQNEAYTRCRGLPARRPRRRDRGHGRLPPRAGARHALPRADGRPSSHRSSSSRRPRLRNPTKFVGPIYARPRPRRSPRARLDRRPGRRPLAAGRPVAASPSASSSCGPSSCSSTRCGRDLRGWWRRPVVRRRDGGLAASRRSSTRTSSAGACSPASSGPMRSPHRCRRRSTTVGARRERGAIRHTDAAELRRSIRRRVDGTEGRGGLPVHRCGRPPRRDRCAGDSPVEMLAGQRGTVLRGQRL